MRSLVGLTVLISALIPTTSALADPGECGETLRRLLGDADDVARGRANAAREKLTTRMLSHENPAF